MWASRRGRLATGREKGRCLGKQRGGQERGQITRRCPVRSGSHASTGLEEATHRQHLLLTLFCHTGPPALHCFLFKKGHKPLRVESVIQQVQGALLSCLGRLGHVVKIQLQGACDRKGFFGGEFLSHRQLRPTLGLSGFRKNSVTSSASIHGLGHRSNPSNSSSPSMASYSICTASHPPTHMSMCPVIYPY